MAEQEEVKTKTRAKPKAKSNAKKNGGYKKYASNKPSAYDQMLLNLREIVSTPKGEWKESDEDVDVSWYDTMVSGDAVNFDNKPYSGLNLALTLDAMRKQGLNVPCFGTANQIGNYFVKNKDICPILDNDFDPEKPIKGLKSVTPIFKWNKTYYENGKAIYVKEDSDKMAEAERKFNNAKKAKIAQFDKMSAEQLEEIGVKKFQGMKYSSTVFALEHLKDQFPEDFIKARPAFAEAEELAKRKMNPEKESEHFVKVAQLIIDAMGVEVIEKKGSHRAYFSKGHNHIVIPERSKFKSDEARLAVILHELGHSTMIPLNRDFGNTAGESQAAKRAYAKEEIVAEMSCSFLCARYGIKSFNSHAKYIKGYADVVCANNNDKVLINLSTKAMQVANYITEKVDAHLLKLAQEAKLKEELDPDLKHKDIELQGSIVVQTIALSTYPEKTFRVMIDVNNPDVVKTDNAKVFKEYQEPKFSDEDPKEFKKKLEAALGTQLLAKYEKNVDALKAKELQKKEAKQREEGQSVKPEAKPERPKLKR